MKNVHSLCHFSAGKIVYGIQLNEWTGCLHHSTPLDVVAVKFKCCQHYYACYNCHLAIADHHAEQWQPLEFDTKAVLCGRCDFEMTIWQYLYSNHACFGCRTPLNPKCRLHWHLYFA